MTDGLTASDVALIQGNGRNNNDDMFGGNGAWWIVLFLIFGWGRNGGYGGFGGGGMDSGAANNYVLASDFATLQRQLSDGFSSVEKDNDRIITGLCDGFYTEAQLVNGVNMNIANNAAAITQAITTNGYENRLGQQMIGQQISNCCCDVRQQISDVNYNNAMNANNITKQISDCCCDTERQIERGFADTNYNMATQNCATLQAIDKVGDRVIDYLANEKMQTLRDENFALRLSASQQAQNAYLIDQLGYHCPQAAYVVQPPQTVSFPLGCNGAANYVTAGCGCGNVN